VEKGTAASRSPTLKPVCHVHGTTFYHKGPLPKNIPEVVHQLRLEKREGGQGPALD
jgi:bifunctional non-homologous end joining protein LigD